MDILQIGHLNCKNFNNLGTKHVIQEYFKKWNIILLQEHWLFKSQFRLFIDMFENYEVSFISKSSMNESVIRKGRPYGGKAII